MIMHNCVLLMMIKALIANVGVITAMKLNSYYSGEIQGGELN